LHFTIRRRFSLFLSLCSFIPLSYGQDRAPPANTGSPLGMNISTIRPRPARAGIKKPPADPAGGQIQDIELKTRFAVKPA